MTFLRRGDKREFILLTEGYLGDTDALQNIYGISLPSDPLIGSAGPDADAAWIIAASARATARARGIDDIGLHLETWIIGHPLKPSAVFHKWFEPEPPESPYRILIHARSYIYRAKVFHEEFWDHRMFALPRIRGHVQRRRLTEQATPFLVSVSRAYESSHDDVVARFEESGHVYSYSSGQSS